MLVCCIGCCLTVRACCCRDLPAAIVEQDIDIEMSQKEELLPKADDSPKVQTPAEEDDEEEEPQHEIPEEFFKGYSSSDEETRKKAGGLRSKNEVISIHVGGAGCNVGHALWELFCIEHGITADGKFKRENTRKSGFRVSKNFF